MSSARLDEAFSAIARSDNVTGSSPVPISVVEDRTATGEEPAPGVMGLIALLGGCWTAHDSREEEKKRSVLWS
jgi:hypothetical protein